MISCCAAINHLSSSLDPQKKKEKEKTNKVENTPQLLGINHRILPRKQKHSRKKMKRVQPQKDTQKIKKKSPNNLKEPQPNQEELGKKKRRKSKVFRESSRKKKANLIKPPFPQISLFPSEFSLSPPKKNPLFPLPLQRQWANDRRCLVELASSSEKPKAPFRPSSG